MNVFRNKTWKGIGSKKVIIDSTPYSGILNLDFHFSMKTFNNTNIYLVSVVLFHTLIKSYSNENIYFCCNNVTDILLVHWEKQTWCVFCTSPAKSNLAYTKYTNTNAPMIYQTIQLHWINIRAKYSCYIIPCLKLFWCFFINKWDSLILPITYSKGLVMNC